MTFSFGLLFIIPGHCKQCWHILCTVYISSCYVHPRFETLDGNAVLQLDPAIPGVFNGPYPLGIDPVKPVF